MIQIPRQIIHLRNKEPVAIMKLIILLLLAGACQTYTPIAERSWVKFQKVPCPTYKSSPLHSEANIIHAMDILIEQRIDKISTMIRKSASNFHAQMTQYTTELMKRIKKSYYESRLWICKETRAPTSIWNVVQPPRTGHFWIKEHGFVLVN